MREIKFKARAVNGGEWIYGMTISHGTIARKRDNLYMEVAPDKWKGIIPETLCQFTGFRDIEGTEVYEGDVIEIKGGGTVTVEWSGYGFHFYGLEDVNGHRLDYLPSPANRMRVTGNIHDRQNRQNNQ